MKRLVAIVGLLLMAVPAWPAKKMTVADVTEFLKQLQEQKKSDQEIATALKEVNLTEELTRGTMNDLASYAPGPQTTVQIYVLEAESAALPPPATEIPNTAAPDSQMQKSLLGKLSEYISKTYSQLPPLTATRTTLRFQDNVEVPGSNSGLVGGAKEITTESGFVHPFAYARYIGSTETKVQSANGIEKPPVKEKGARWGANGQIALFGPEQNPGTVFHEAEDSGGLTFTRWQTINGKAAAVFAFAVQKNKSHYAVDYCCFPDVTQTGVAIFASPILSGNGIGGAHGNFQTSTDWHDFKATSVPYHGELFVDPDTGIVVRMVTFAEFKNTDVVRQEDERIDYAPVKVGDKYLVLPVRKLLNTEVVPTGDSGSAGKYTTRRTLLTSEYKDFQTAEK